MGDESAQAVRGLTKDAGNYAIEGAGMSDVDVLHLSYTSPFAAGSYNRSFPAIVDRLPEFRHRVLSSSSTHPVGAETPPWLDLRGPEHLGTATRLVTQLPMRLRSVARPAWPQHPDRLAFTLLARRALTALRPAVVICYDDHKTAIQLRSAAPAGTRIGFSQHGYSYYLSAEQATRLYSLAKLDFVIIQSQAAYQFERSRIAAYEPRVEVIENAVDTDFFRPPSPTERAAARRHASAADDDLIVGFVGRLVPKKGVHILLQAWTEILQRHPNAVLRIAGDGPKWYLDDLRSTISRLGLPRVQLLGQLDPDGVRSLMWACDVYALPTLFCEGFPRSVIEAMGCGCAVVSGEFPAAREQLTDEAVVLVSEPNLPARWASALADLLDDPPLRAQMGRAGRELASTRFCQDRWIGDLRSCYRREVRSRNVRAITPDRSD